MGEFINFLGSCWVLSKIQLIGVFKDYQPNVKLTQKEGQVLFGGDKQEAAFPMLKQKFCGSCTILHYLKERKIMIFFEIPRCFKDGFGSRVDALKKIVCASDLGGTIFDLCDAFDSDVDEAPTAQTMFMENLSLAYPIYDEAGQSYDSDILSEAAQCVSVNEQNKVVNASLTAELARYKEQLRIIITDRNIKEESLKNELHSVKMQLNSTINHNKSMVEEVTTLKKDFKQKENKYLEDFLDMKALKEKVAIGYKSPLYITRAKQVQPALYNGHDLVKTNHTRAVVHDSEDTLDIAEKTRIGMLEKMKSTLWVDSKIKIRPPDYSKENYLATFTQQRQLTPEQIFWSSDLEEVTPKPISKMTVYPPNTPTRLVPRVLPQKVK
ncbi:hypothetical protein Tco_1146015 [Tanacetum coccineum]